MLKFFSQNTKFFVLMLGAAIVLFLIPFHSTKAATCAELGGTYCFETQLCSQPWLPASDVYECCPVACTTAPPIWELFQIPSITDWAKAIIDAFVDIIGWILNLGVTIVASVVALGLGILALISAGVLGVVVGLLAWMIDILTQIPITHDNEMVRIGWAFCRDFVNMLFILILAFIGLATILRLETYQAKKALPLLLIMIVLVNFSLVFVGFVVDMGNIFTNFFVTKLTATNWLDYLIGGSGGSSFISQAIAYFGNIITNISNAILGQGADTQHTEGLEWTYSIGLIIQGIVLIFYNIFTTLIFGVIVFLFLIRVLALWLIAIVAPLAFFSYVLPATRRYWGGWWKHLIQWSFIAAPVLFALYLAAQLNRVGVKIGVTNIESSIETKLASEATWYGIGNLLNPIAISLIGSILTPFLSLLVVCGGILFSISFAPAFAGSAMKYGKAGAAWVATRRPVATRLGKLAGLTEEQIAKGASLTQKMDEKAGQLPGGKYWAQPFTKSLRYAMRGGQLLIGPELSRVGAELRKPDLPKNWNRMNADERAEYMKNYMIEDADWATIGSEMKNKGDLSKIKDKAFHNRMKAAANKFIEDPRYKREAVNTLNAYAGTEMTEEIKLKLAGPEKADEVKRQIDEMVNDIEAKAKISVEIDAEINTEAGKKGLSREKYLRNLAGATLHMESFKYGDIESSTKDSMTSLASRLAFQRLGPEHLQALRQNFDKETNKKVLEEAGGINAIKSKEEFEEAYRQSPDSFRRILTNPGTRDTALIFENYIPGGVKHLDEFDGRMRREKEERKFAEAEEIRRIHEGAIERAGETEMITRTRAAWPQAEDTEIREKLLKQERNKQEEREAQKNMSKLRKEIQGLEGRKIKSGPEETRLQELKEKETGLAKILRRKTIRETMPMAENNASKLKDKIEKLEKQAFRIPSEEENLTELKTELSVLQKKIGDYKKELE